MTLLNRGDTNKGWNSATGIWDSARKVNVTFNYTDEFSEEMYLAFAQAIVSAAGDELSWSIPAAARQLRTNVDTHAAAVDGEATLT